MKSCLKIPMAELELACDFLIPTLRRLRQANKFKASMLDVQRELWQARAT